MKYAVGIDIGKKGGIVIIDEKNNVITMSMPQIKNEIDTHRIVQILKSLDGEIHVGMEDLHAIFGSSATAMFQFGRALGIIEASVIAFDLPFTKIPPKVWQKEMWMGIKPVEINTGKLTKSGQIKYKIDTKGTSLLAAKRLFPTLDLKDPIVKITKNNKESHDGIIDSLLIAAYVKRNLL